MFHVCSVLCLVCGMCLGGYSWFTVWLRLFWLVVIVTFVEVWGCFCVGLDFVFFVLFSYFVW